MDIDWRAPAVAGVVAFFLAALTGLIAGVGFGAIVGRSLLGAVVFGALGLGGDMLARKYLPELYASPAGADDEREDVEASDEEGGAVDITIEEENPHVHDDADVVSDRVDAPEPAIVDAVNRASEVEELEAASAPPPDDGSDLPSFDSIERSFQPPDDGEEEEEDHTAAASPGVSAGIDVLGQEEDPETVARAVRTLLQRDHEG